MNTLETQVNEYLQDYIELAGNDACLRDFITYMLNNQNTAD